MFLIFFGEYSFVSRMHVRYTWNAMVKNGFYWQSVIISIKYTPANNLHGLRVILTDKSPFCFCKHSEQFCIGTLPICSYIFDGQFLQIFIVELFFCTPVHGILLCLVFRRCVSFVYSFDFSSATLQFELNSARALLTWACGTRAQLWRHKLELYFLVCSKSFHIENYHDLIW